MSGVDSPPQEEQLQPACHDLNFKLRTENTRLLEMVNRLTAADEWHTKQKQSLRQELQASRSSQSGEHERFTCGEDEVNMRLRYDMSAAFNFSSGTLQQYRCTHTPPGNSLHCLRRGPTNWSVAVFTDTCSLQTSSNDRVSECLEL